MRPPRPSVRYRALCDGLSELRASCDAATQGLAAAKEGLLRGFEAWAATQQQLPDAGAASTPGVAGSLNWAAGAAAGAAAADGGGGARDEDPDELYAAASLARKAAAAGDPGSAAFFAAQRARGARRGGGA